MSPSLAESYFDLPAEETITHRTVTRGAYGSVSSVEAAVDGRWEDTSHKVRDREGQDAISSGIIYVKPDLDVSYEDQFYVGGAWRGVIKIDKPKDFSVDHQLIHVA